MKITEKLAELSTGARSRVASAANKVEAVNTPVKTLGQAGHELNSLVHDAAERMLEQNVAIIQGLVGDGAQRLRLLAKASDLRSAANQQLAYFDVTRKRLARELRGTYAVVADAGRGAASVAVRTYATLMRPPVVKTKSLKTKGRKAA